MRMLRVLVSLLHAFLFCTNSSALSSLMMNAKGQGSVLNPLLNDNRDNNDNIMNNQSTKRLSRRDTLSCFVASTLVPAVALVGRPNSVEARLEAVNRPDLLPPEAGMNVIQTEKFLTTGQARRMDQMLNALERDTGFRVRVLCQNYPNTPGLAIREYWDLGKEGQKDDKYVVLVVDQFGGKGNVLNFNVGDGVKLALPNVFWTRLSGTYGTLFYVRENGIDLAISNAVEAIVTCLRSEDQYCVAVPSTAPSLKSLGFS